MNGNCTGRTGGAKRKCRSNSELRKIRTGVKETEGHTKYLDEEETPSGGDENIFAVRTAKRKRAGHPREEKLCRAAGRRTSTMYVKT